MPRYFLGIAERIHARLCSEAGVVVLGLKGPQGVSKLEPGDGVIYYSPKTEPGGETLQAFTAIGTVVGATAYERSFDATSPIWIRDTEWMPNTKEVPIRPLLDALSWVKKPKNWGFYMRGSYREISKEDYDLIRQEMLGAGS